MHWRLRNRPGEASVPFLYFSPHDKIAIRGWDCNPPLRSPSELGISHARLVCVVDQSWADHWGWKIGILLRGHTCLCGNRKNGGVWRTVPTKRKGKEQQILSTLAILSCSLLSPIRQKEKNSPTVWRKYRKFKVRVYWPWMFNASIFIIENWLLRYYDMRSLWCIKWPLTMLHSITTPPPSL